MSIVDTICSCIDQSCYMLLIIEQSIPRNILMQGLLLDLVLSEFNKKWGCHALQIHRFVVIGEDSFQVLELYETRVTRSITTSVYV